ncbi:LLM class flavin-dependent oxidoreductase [Actinomadura sp. 1N219]|uniref:LLM class flavin-dependent oxidoreductase n=1 Tax=Actinomadura sp. 1N219 TaxID=3375152 RepID=UPI0037986DC8
MRLSLGLRARSTGLGPALDAVTATAGLGVDGYWAPATPDTDPFQVSGQAWQRAAAQGATVETGVGVLPVGDWNVMSAATAAATVATLQGGGFRLGIGSGRLASPAWRRSRGLPDDVRPLAAVEEWLRALRSLLAGRATTLQGHYLRLEDVSIETTPPPVPLYVGAAGVRMLGLAGRLADGVICGLLRPRDLPAVREILDAGRRESELTGRPRIVLSLPVVIADDPDEAAGTLLATALPLALGNPALPSGHGFPQQLRRLGHGAELDRLRALRDAGATAAAIRAELSPDLLASLGVAGTLDDAAARLAEYAQAGADELTLTFGAAVPAPERIGRLLDLTRARVRDGARPDTGRGAR